MKRILVIGIVLLALLALTNVVSAATEGVADIRADVNVLQESIDLTVTNYIGSWTLGPGINIVGDFSGNTGIYVVFQQANCPNGITVRMADKLDDNKPAETGGKMVEWCETCDPHSWNGTHALANRIQFGSNWHGFTGFSDVTGTDTVVANLEPMFDVGAFSLELRQVIEPSDQNGHYRIVLTFTATPN